MMPIQIIAQSFFDSLVRLSAAEQKATNETVIELWNNPASTGLNPHRIDKTKDKNFWSVRVNSDIRLILHKTSDRTILCFAAHHDDAYRWAERRKIETHPQTGAAQIVEIRETIKEIAIPSYVQEKQKTLEKTLLFKSLTDDDLLGIGVPQDWIEDIKQANEDSLLSLADHLPPEAAEALFQIAVGVPFHQPNRPDAGADPFSHPDAKRRFRVISGLEELQRAFEFPWDKWTVFLHPEQQVFVERDFSGPARVSGSAGTGKTVVAVHRAVHLARNNPNARVLLTTFSDTLANSLRIMLRRLIYCEPKLAERIDVYSLPDITVRLSTTFANDLKIIGHSQLLSIIDSELKPFRELNFGFSFLAMEWENVVDAWNLQTWDDYKSVRRLGRKTKLNEAQRRQLWDLFAQIRMVLNTNNQITMAGALYNISDKLKSSRNLPYDFVVVDECQDLTQAHLTFLNSLVSQKANNLFFAGDLGQRIFQQPFSWKAVGVDIRGRSKTLTVNYRTSHQIRRVADRLLNPEFADVDGNQESRSTTVSVFNGPEPRIEECRSFDEEQKLVAEWLTERNNEGILPHEIAIFVRSQKEMERAEKSTILSELKHHILDSKMEICHGKISIGTMHLAKGLEFRAVVVMGCDDEIIPFQARIESIGDTADLEEVYCTERHLLYVACTRARDNLLVTSGAMPSEFLNDLRNR